MRSCLYLAKHRSRPSASRPSLVTLHPSPPPRHLISKISPLSRTHASLKFYRDLLGLKFAGESMNRGTEQEHLNNVAGAHLRISSLRAQNGPGIEFLDYLAPKDGRPTPADTRANDLWHWQTVLSTPSVATAAQKIRSARGRLVSSGPVAIPDASLGFTKGFLARDPDGHGLQLIEK
jgi:catechol 2,3-dioxygenase-like lactoylglutathione lyase family enzyme